MRKLRFLAFVVVVVATATGSASAGVLIEAKVDGVKSKIGELDARIDAADAGRAIGEFLFSPDMGKYDMCFDFQWVNVLVGYENPVGTSKPTDPFIGKIPGIDPQAPPTNPNEDNKPFYYKNSEWLPPGKVYDGVTIHEEGVGSRFVDRPSDGTENSLIKFMSYLVINRVNEKIAPLNVFEVIGVIDWEYRNNSDETKGTSLISRVAGTPTISAADIDLINTAIGNAGPNGFGTWKAVAPGTLNVVVCPEPGSIVLASLGLLVLGGLGLKRRVAA